MLVNIPIQMRHLETEIPANVHVQYEFPMLISCSPIVDNLLLLKKARIDNLPTAIKEQVIHRFMHSAKKPKNRKVSRASTHPDPAACDVNPDLFGHRNQAPASQH